MSDVTLGKIIEGTAARDAVHVAVAPVVAATVLAPGQRVAFTGFESYVAASAAAGVGIVDPFLEAPVRAGEHFWLFVYPNTVTGLRHDWSHPAFVAPPASVESAEDDYDGCRGC